MVEISIEEAAKAVQAVMTQVVDMAEVAEEPLDPMDTKMEETEEEVLVKAEDRVEVSTFTASDHIRLSPLQEDQELLVREMALTMAEKEE